MSERICVQWILDVLKSVLMTLANKLQALRCSAFALGGTLICLLLLRTFVHSIALFVVRKGFQFQMILSYSLWGSVQF